MVPVALVMLRRAPAGHACGGGRQIAGRQARPRSAYPPGSLQTLLCVAGVGCCVAMAMPQVHIVAYCGDLGYGAGARRRDAGADDGARHRQPGTVRASLPTGIGGLATLLIGSGLQALSLLLYMLFNGLSSLYIISALFGLFQGGIIPMYAVIVREYFPPREAGMRVGVVLMATLVGMALGGWLSGWIFDLTGSYQAAFLNGAVVQFA